MVTTAANAVGSWQYEQDAEGHYVIADGQTIALIVGGACGRDAQALGERIAATPDLLAACQEATRMLECIDREDIYSRSELLRALATVRAALRKAGAGREHQLLQHGPRQQQPVPGRLRRWVAALRGT